MRKGHFRPNRVLSEALTPFLLKTPLTPNHVTLWSMLMGLTAGFSFSHGTYAGALAGAFFYEFAMVLDNCDGEIARAKNMKSALGAWLDIVADFVTDISLFLGIAIGCLRQGVEGPIGLFAFLCLSGGLLHLTLVILEKLKGFGPAVYENPNPGTESRQNPVFIFFDALREGEASWFIVIFCVLGKALWLLWFGGIYMQILWASALILNFRHLTAKKAVR